MTLLVSWLFVETQRTVERERQASLDGKIGNDLRRERCTYAIVTSFFALSYIGRFVTNEYVSCEEGFNGNRFGLGLTYVTVYFIEGASMGVLMMFHYMNFS